MKKHTLLVIATGIAFVGLGAWASPAYGGAFELYTINSFVNLLIEKGIIPEREADTAHELADIIKQVEGFTESASARNADKVTVRVSQDIEQANLEFAFGTDIEGMLLLVQNTTTELVQLEAKRGCQVVYRIYDEAGTLLYDSAQSEVCQTDEKVTYMLEGDQFRMFPITHREEDLNLERGVYRFEVTYPGYGQGERVVTVQ